MPLTKFKTKYSSKCLCSIRSAITKFHFFGVIAFLLYFDSVLYILKNSIETISLVSREKNQKVLIKKEKYEQYPFWI